MTENFEILEHVINLIAKTEELFAINNAIAGGLVTDPTEIMLAAARSAEYMETMLRGHQLMLGDNMPADFVANTLNSVYDKS